MREKIKLVRVMQRIFILCSFLFLFACSTQGKFKVPEGTQLSVYKRPPITVPADGIVTMKPFFWTAAGVAPAGGAPYALYKNGKIIKEGKLRVKIRVVSFFWPPFAAIYWPIGLNPEITYDLVNDKQM